MNPGDRIELVRTRDPYTRLVPGDRGTVQRVTTDPATEAEVIVDVEWDSGSKLSLVSAVGDRWRVVPQPGDSKFTPDERDLRITHVRHDNDGRETTP